MFTQYMFNGLIINPAYASVDEALNVTAVSRHQWVGFKGAPNTQTLSVHTPVNESNTSVGVILMRDQIAEVITDNAAMLTLSQRVEIGEETYLALGINAGFSKYRANYSDISNESAIDPVFYNDDDIRNNIGFGLMFFTNRFYAGISSPYFTSIGKKKSETSFKPQYMLHGGYLLDLGENLKFKPNVLLKYVNGSPMQVDMNANFLLAETLWLGGSWRSFDTMNFIAELQVTPKIQLGYSYDLTTSQLAGAQKGSHEIMLNFRFPFRGDMPRCYF